MPNRFIVIGDSHTVTFRPFDASIAAIYHPGAITLDAFCRPGHELTLQVGEFLKTINPDNGTLVFCMSEVDIRVHYWRELPLLMSRGMPLEQAIAMKLRAFVDRATAVCQQFGYDRFILWGAPASSPDGTASEAQFPTTGDNITRNILTHIFNHLCTGLARSGHPTFRFATLFYDMVREDFATDPTWLLDDIHVSNSFKPLCLERLEQIVSGQTAVAVGERMDRFHQRAWALGVRPISAASGHSQSWSRRGWLQVAADPQIRFDDKEPGGFSFTEDVLAAARAGPVKELILMSEHGGA